MKQKKEQKFVKKKDKKHSNPDYKTIFPPKSAYHFPSTKSHISPCMDIYFLSIPIRERAARSEWDFEEKEDNEFD